MGPKILLFSVVFEFSLIHISAVYSLYLPVSFKNPAPGRIRDGPSGFGESFVTLEAPYTSGTPEFFANKKLSFAR